MSQTSVININILISFLLNSIIENFIQGLASVIFFRIFFLNFILDHVIIVVLIWVDTIDVCAKKDLNLKKMNDHANASNQNAT